MIKDNFKGAGSIMLATILFSLTSVFSRMIGLSFGAFSQNWIRNFLVFIFVGLYVLTKKNIWRPIMKNHIRWLLVWTLSGSLTFVLLFVTFNKLPLGTTFFLFYSSAIITSYLSGKIFFFEKINYLKIVSIVLVLLGLALIYSFDVRIEKTYYIIVALIAGVMNGLWNTLSKKNSSKYPNLQLIVIDSLVSSVVGFIGAFIAQESLPTLTFNTSCLGLILNTFTTLAGTSLTIYGFKHIEAQLGSIIMSLEAVFGTLLGLIFFKEILPFTTFFGGALIVIASMLPNIFTPKPKIYGRKPSE